MLLEVINMPNSHPELAAAEDKGEKAFDMVLRSDRFRNSVIYQPRIWYNAYQVNASYFEGEPGDLLVHFPDIGGDKWSAMAELIAQPAERMMKWDVPLEQTTYEREISDYWERLRRASKLLDAAYARMGEPAVQDAVRRLQYATTYEMDREEKMIPALSGLQDALGLRDDDTVV
jgi:hypothetical protein